MGTLSQNCVAPLGHAAAAVKFPKTALIEWQNKGAAGSGA
jgi:hypothetical protein